MWSILKNKENLRQNSFSFSFVTKFTLIMLNNEKTSSHHDDYFDNANEFSDVKIAFKHQPGRKQENSFVLFRFDWRFCRFFKKQFFMRTKRFFPKHRQLSKLFSLSNLMEHFISMKMKIHRLFNLLMFEIFSNLFILNSQWKSMRRTVSQRMMSTGAFEWGWVSGRKANLAESEDSGSTFSP